MTPDNYLYTYPKTDLNLTDCLDSIECTIAFDVRDWSEDNRSAWIYGIVFGWNDDEGEVELKNKFHWSDADINRLHTLHEQWIRLKQMRGNENGK